MPKSYNPQAVRSLSIRRFKLRKIKLGSNIQIVGARNNGKSKLMQEFCYVNKDRFDEVHVWSYTDFMNMEFEDFIPKQNIHHRFKERDLRKIVDRQQRAWRKYKYNTKKGLPATPGKEVCILLDDCAFKGDIWSCETVNELFYNGRHSHITFVFVTQDAGDLGKKQRGQVDIVFATREIIKVNIKTLHDNYFGIFDLPRDFRRTFHELTEDFSMLVLVKNLSRSNDVEQLVYWYKANINLPPFRMGRPEEWVISDQMVDEEDPEEQARRDEELVKQKVQEAINAKQPLHQVLKCDSHGRPIDPKQQQHKTRSARQRRQRRRHNRHRRHRQAGPSTLSTSSAGMARFDQSYSTQFIVPQNNTTTFVYGL